MGPTSTTQITLSTAWQRFRITGTLAGGQTGLWIVARQFAGNGDTWTTGSIHLGGACLHRATIQRTDMLARGRRKPRSSQPEWRAAQS